MCVCVCVCVCVCQVLGSIGEHGVVSGGLDGSVILWKVYTMYVASYPYYQPHTAYKLHTAYPILPYPNTLYTPILHTTYCQPPGCLSYTLHTVLLAPYLYWQNCIPHTRVLILHVYCVVYTLYRTGRERGRGEMERYSHSYWELGHNAMTFQCEHCVCVDVSVCVYFM